MNFQTKYSSTKQFLYSLLLFSLVGQSCTDLSEINDLDIEEQEIELAIPLINTEFSVNDFTGGDGPDNVSIKVDAEDRVTLVYQGDVVRQDITAVFPSVPAFAFPLLDSAYAVPVPFAADQRVDRAIFGKTIMQFAFTHEFSEDVTVAVTIPQLSKDGKIYTQNFTIPYEGVSPTVFESPEIPLEDWTLISENNNINVTYDARTMDGERQLMSPAFVVFQNITFDYVEGYFGSEVFDINGDFVSIGVLETWRSGGLAFEDPKVNVFVENAFGFPVRSIFNTMQVVTTTGEMLDMESDVIDNNVDFAYPSLSEQSEVKITEFSFNKDNSNIVELFKEKVVRVTYDIDAGANPDMDETITGFINEDSYFLVSVDVELPLHGSINNLVLQDTVDLDLSDLEDATSAEFKNVIKNNFPADITLQAYFFDDNDVLLDSLFTERLFMPAAPVDGNTGKAAEGGEVITFENFESARFENVRKGKKVLVNVKINTQQAAAGPLWIYNDYGIIFKVGAKVKTTL